MARSNKLPRDPGLPKELPDAAAQLRALVSRLNSLIPRQHDTVNSLVDGYLLHVGSLPTPDETNRGRMVILRGAPGSADRLFWCKKQANDTYVWQEVLQTMGGGGAPSPIVYGQGPISITPFADFYARRADMPHPLYPRPIQPVSPKGSGTMPVSTMPVRQIIGARAVRPPKRPEEMVSVLPFGAVGIER